MEQSSDIEGDDVDEDLLIDEAHLFRQTFEGANVSEEEKEAEGKRKKWKVANDSGEKQAEKTQTSCHSSFIPTKKSDINWRNGTHEHPAIQQYYPVTPNKTELCPVDNFS